MLVTTSFPEEGTGSEAAGSFVLDLASTLAKQMKVLVVVPGSRTGEERRGQLRIIRFAVLRLPLSLLNPANPAHWRATLQTVVQGRRVVQRLVAEEELDHIFALWALPSGYWARAASRVSDIPYSVWALGSDIWTLGRLPLVRQILRTVLRESQYCFADGYELKQDAERIAGRECRFLCSARRLPVQSERAARPSSPYRLAFLGRWHPNKGADLLMASLAQLEERDWARISEVRLAGGGPLEREIKASARRLQVAGRPITVRSYLDKTAAAELITWADFMLIPSRIESIPVIFSDAMQCGTPVVVTPVGDLPRLLRKYSVGEVATEVSAPAFALALKRALVNTESDYTLGLEEARQAFDLDRVCQQLLECV